MFENLIAEVLNRLLGSYVTSDSFQADRVNTSVYQGHVSLSKLELRPDALDRLLLPVTLKRGTINSVEISIPWTALGSKSLEMTLDGVTLVLNPKTDWTDEELDRRERATKAALLLQAEVARGLQHQQHQQHQNNNTASSSSSNSFTSRMIANVIVRLRNVQVKFETLQYSFSLSIGRFEMQNTNAQWEPFFSQDVQSQPQFRLVRLDQVSLYDEDRAAFILPPFNLSLRQQTNPRDQSSRTSLQVHQPVQVFVVHSQLEHFVEISKLRAYSKHRPTQTALMVPRQWWTYAFQLVLKRVREKRYRRTKEYFTKRRRDRLEYTYLWKLSLAGGGGGGAASASGGGSESTTTSTSTSTLSAHNKAKLEFLEGYLDLSDILLFRSYAENELRLEKAHQELWELSSSSRQQQQQLSQHHQQQQLPTSVTGWIAWARGMRSGVSAAAAATAAAGSSSSSSATGAAAAGASTTTGGGMALPQRESLSQQDVERFLALLRFNPAKSVLEANGGGGDINPRTASASASSSSPPQWITCQIPVLSVVWSPKLRMRLEQIEFELQKRVSSRKSSTRFSIQSIQVYDVLEQVVGGPSSFLTQSDGGRPSRRQLNAIVEEPDYYRRAPSPSPPSPTPPSQHFFTEQQEEEEESKQHGGEEAWLDLARPSSRLEESATATTAGVDDEPILVFSLVEDGSTGAQSISIVLGALEAKLTPLLLERAADLGKLAGSFHAGTGGSAAPATTPSLYSASSSSSTSTPPPLAIAPPPPNIRVKIRGATLKLPMEGSSSNGNGSMSTSSVASSSHGSSSNGNGNGGGTYLVLSIGQCSARDQFLKEEDDLSSNDDGEDDDDDDLDDLDDDDDEEEGGVAGGGGGGLDDTTNANAGDDSGLGRSRRRRRKNDIISEQLLIQVKDIHLVLQRGNAVTKSSSSSLPDLPLLDPFPLRLLINSKRKRSSETKESSYRLDLSEMLTLRLYPSAIKILHQHVQWMSQSKTPIVVSESWAKSCLLTVLPEAAAKGEEAAAAALKARVFALSSPYDDDDAAGGGRQAEDQSGSVNGSDDAVSEFFTVYDEFMDSMSEASRPATSAALLRPTNNSSLHMKRGGGGDSESHYSFFTADSRRTGSRRSHQLAAPKQHRLLPPGGGGGKSRLAPIPTERPPSTSFKARLPGIRIQYYDAEDDDDEEEEEKPPASSESATRRLASSPQHSNRRRPPLPHSGSSTTLHGGAASSTLPAHVQDWLDEVKATATTTSTADDGATAAALRRSSTPMLDFNRLHPPPPPAPGSAAAAAGTVPLAATPRFPRSTAALVLKLDRFDFEWSHRHRHFALGQITCRVPTTGTGTSTGTTPHQHILDTYLFSSELALDKDYGLVEADHMERAVFLSVDWEQEGTAFSVRTHFPLDIVVGNLDRLSRLLPAAPSDDDGAAPRMNPAAPQVTETASPAQQARATLHSLTSISQLRAWFKGDYHVSASNVDLAMKRDPTKVDVRGRVGKIAAHERQNCFYSKLAMEEEDTVAVTYFFPVVEMREIKDEVGAAANTTSTTAAAETDEVTALEEAFDEEDYLEENEERKETTPPGKVAMLDEVLDSLLEDSALIDSSKTGGGKSAPTAATTTAESVTTTAPTKRFDMWQQGVDVALTIAPVRIDVGTLYRFAQKQMEEEEPLPPAAKPQQRAPSPASTSASSSSSSASASSPSSKFVMRFNVNVLQPEFELGVENVSVVCEKISLSNAHYCVVTSKGAALVQERVDAAVHQVSLLKEDAPEHVLPLIDPCLYELKLRKVDSLLAVSLSDLVLNVDQSQLSKIAQHASAAGAGGGRTPPPPGQDAADRKSGSEQLDVAVHLSRVTVNLITYPAPNSAYYRNYSASLAVANAHGLVTQRAATPSSSSVGGKLAAAADNSSSYGGQSQQQQQHRHPHRIIATLGGEGIDVRYSGGGQVDLVVGAFAVTAGQVRMVDLARGVRFTKRVDSVIELSLVQPKVRYDHASWNGLQMFVAGVDTGAAPKQPQPSRQPTSTTTIRLAITDLELCLMPSASADDAGEAGFAAVAAAALHPPNDSFTTSTSTTVAVLYVADAQVDFTSLAKFRFELRGISSWLRRQLDQDKAKARFLCYPFNITMPSSSDDDDKVIEISPIRVQATKRDMEAILALATPPPQSSSAAEPDEAVRAAEQETPAAAAAAPSTASSSPSPSSTPPLSTSTTTTPAAARIEAKLVLKSLDLVLLSEFSLPVVQVVFAAFELTSTASLLHGRVRVRAEFYKRQCWQVLMEEVPFAFHVNETRLAVSSTQAMEWNLCESLLDHQLDGRVKIKSLVNHTGLHVERVDADATALVGSSSSSGDKDFFCSVGELLSFRLTSTTTTGTDGAMMMLRNIACPKPGQSIKVPLTSSRDAFIVMETKANALVLRSLLHLHNDCANQLELVVSSEPSSSSSSSSLPPSRTTTPIGSQHSSSEDFSNTPRAARHRRLRGGHPQAGGGVIFSCVLYPNDAVYLPPVVAHAVLHQQHALCLRPHSTTWGAGVEYEFKELKVSHSARQNEKRLKRTLSFGEDEDDVASESVGGGGSFSSSSGGAVAAYVHYAVTGNWLDQFSQRITLAAPVVLVNHLNCAATYCLDGGSHARSQQQQQLLAHYQIPRCEGQLPVGHELKWHGALLPHQSSQLRLSLKLAGFDWSEPVPTTCGTQQDAVVELELRDETRRVLRVSATVKYHSPQRVEITLWVPYWIVNKTQLPVLCSSSSAFGLAAGQTKTLAVMRRIRLQQQLQTRRNAAGASGAGAASAAAAAATSTSSSSAPSSVAAASFSSASSASLARRPTGLLELLEDAYSGEEIEDTVLLFAKPDLKIRLWNSRWSTSACVLEHGAQTTVLECKQEWKLTPASSAAPRALHVITAKVTDSRFPETKVVTLTPRFLLVNALDRTVRVRQAQLGYDGDGDEDYAAAAAANDHPHTCSSSSSVKPSVMFSGERSAGKAHALFSSAEAVSLLPGASAAFHWRDKAAPKQISACFEDFGWEWSGGVNVEDCVGEFCARMRNRLTHVVYILRVDVQVEGPHVVVTLREELPQLPPYRIDNLSLYTLRFKQVGAAATRAETLLPYHSSAYSWDVLTDDRRRLAVEALPRRAHVLVVNNSSSNGSEGGDVQTQQPQVLRRRRRGWWWPSPSTWFFSRPRDLGEFSLDHGFGFLASNMPNLSVSLQADGPTRVLTVCDSRVLLRGGGGLALPGRGDEDASSSSPAATLSSPPPKLGFTFKMGGLGVTLVEDADEDDTGTSSSSSASGGGGGGGQVRRRELVRIYVTQPSVSLSRHVQLESAVSAGNSLTRAAQAASIVVGNVFELRLRDVQIDNQLLNAAYPVLLCLGRGNATRPRHHLNVVARTKTDDDDDDGEVVEIIRGDDLVVVRAVKSNRFAASLEFLKSFSIHIAPIQLNLDADIVKAAMSLTTRVSKKLPLLLPSGGSGGDEAATAPPKATTTTAAAPKKIYVEDLRIDPIQVRVNFRNVFSMLRSTTAATTTTGGGAAMFGANVEGAVLYLNEFHISHSLLSAASDSIANRVAEHYLQSLRRHWYVLISSVNVFGDPVGLGKTVWLGVVRALRKVHSAVLTGSPLVVVEGVAKAGWLVVSAVVLGTTNSLVNLLNGVTGALQYAVQGGGVSFPPPRHLLDSVAQGVAGLVVHPYDAVRRELEQQRRQQQQQQEQQPARRRRGQLVRAAVVGTARGVLGLVAHPLIGWLKLCTRVVSALRATVDPSAKVRTLRNRTPRFFRPDQRIRKFDAVRAQGEEALWLVGLGRQLHWRRHLELSDTLLLVLTDSMLVVVQRRAFTGDVLHVREQIGKLDFVHADAAATAAAAATTTSRRKTTTTAAAEAELRLVVLQPSAMAFKTLSVPCRTAQVAAEARDMANAWRRQNQ